MTPIQREALAQHLDALGFHFAAHAVRHGYDTAEYRTGNCGCELAVLAPCVQHRAKVAA